ncbi:phenylacetate--CoA ligase family protein [Calditrichota bacterium]
MSLHNIIVENIALPLGDRVLGTTFMHELKRWREIQHYTRDQLEHMQHHNLQNLLKNAVQNIPYYGELGIKIEEDPYSTLKKFPLLTKKIMNSRPDDLVQGDRSKLVSNTSSGSSGHRVSTYDSGVTKSITRAVHTLCWEWGGFRLGEPFMQLGMELKRSRVKRIKDIMLRTAYTQSFHLEKQEVLNNLSPYRGTSNAVFGGYASGLYAYAKFANEAGLEDVTFKSVLSWGDKMFPHFRELLESQFHTKVYDLYGCAEGIVGAAQCTAMNYHIPTPHVIIEVIDREGNACLPGELGRVILTRLDNNVMPLIRYDVGDLAILADPDKACSCGMNFPLMEKIIGRDTDIVYSRSGKFMIVHFFTGIFEYIPQVKQFRVIQRDLDGIEIEYIKADGFIPATLDFAVDKIRGYLKEDFRIDFTEVREIPPTTSGKPQIVKSEIARMPLQFENG